METSWLDNIVCRENPELFYSDDKSDQEAAKRYYCQQCPSVQDCFVTAMVRREEGVWGGTTEAERKRMRPQWERDNAPVRLALERRYGSPNSVPVVEGDNNLGKYYNAPVSARYDRRLSQVKLLLEALDNDPDAYSLPYYDDCVSILELVVRNPTKPYEQIAAKFNKSKTWAVKLVGELTERYGLQ